MQRPHLTESPSAFGARSAEGIELLLEGKRSVGSYDNMIYTVYNIWYDNAQSMHFMTGCSRSPWGSFGVRSHEF